MADKTRMTIATAETRYGTAGGLTAAEVVVLRFGGDGAALNAPTSSTVTVTAYVNHGRWIVNCPFGCGSAQYAAKDDPRFWCVECNNAGSGKWAKVVWPDDPAAIENALTVRADQHTANWQPGETVAALVAENTTAGITPDVGVAT